MNLESYDVDSLRKLVRGLGKGKPGTEKTARSGRNTVCQK